MRGWSLPLATVLIATGTAGALLADPLGGSSAATTDQEPTTAPRGEEPTLQTQPPPRAYFFPANNTRPTTIWRNGTVPLSESCPFETCAQDGGREVLRVEVTPFIEPGVPTVIYAQVNYTDAPAGPDFVVAVSAGGAQVHEHWVWRPGGYSLWRAGLVRSSGASVEVVLNLLWGQPQGALPGNPPGVEAQYSLRVAVRPVPHAVPFWLCVAFHGVPGATITVTPTPHEAAGEEMAYSLWDPRDNLVSAGTVPYAPLRLELPSGAGEGEYVLRLQALDYEILTILPGVRLETNKVPDGGLSLRALRVERSDTPTYALPSSGTLTWEFDVPRAPVSANLFLLMAPQSVASASAATLDSPVGRVINWAVAAGTESVGVLAQRVTPPWWFTSPGDPALVPGTYQATLTVDAAVNVSAGVTIERYDRGRPNEGPGAFVADLAGDADDPSVVSWRVRDAQGQPVSERYDIRSVEMTAGDAGRATIDLSVVNLTALTVPDGWDSVVYAAGFDTGAGVFMVGFIKADNRQEFFCAPDTLVLAVTQGDPNQVPWVPITGTTRVLGDGGFTFELVPACMGPNATTPVAVSRFGAAVFAMRDPAVPLGQDAMLQVIDFAGGPVDLTIFSAPPAPPAPTAGDGATASGGLFPLLLLLPIALLAAGGTAAAVLLRRRRLMPAADATPVAGPPVPGSVFLQKYRVDRELGRGAFGTVWLAHHTKLDRSVVIKQLHPEWASVAEARSRFEREARILAKLDHPNVTRIYDVDQVGGAWYLVMEYVARGSLEDLVASGPLPAGRAASIAADMLQGLGYIHAAGVLHRDIKPSNILIAADDTAKLADFGISRSNQFQTTMLTASGSPPGTPLYMAPEQVQGQTGDARSDLFAVAAVVYKLLSGRAHIGDVPAGFLDLLKALADRPPELPVPGVPAALNAWLAKGLAKRPDDRFQSADEMLSALRTAAATTSAAPPRKG